MESEQSSDDEEVIVQMITSGTIPGFGNDDSSDKAPQIRMSAPNKKQSFEQSDARFERLYFNDKCVYSGIHSKRRFQMRKSVFDCILRGISGKGIFVQRFDVTKIKLLQKERV